MNESEENDSLIVLKEEVGERLDKVLAARFKGAYSRTYFQYLIDEQLVLLNGAPVKKRMKLHIDDEIEVQFAATPEITLLPEPIPLSIIYEDPFLIAINKPPGMVVHPAPGNWTATFVNALLYHCNQIECHEGSLRPGIVHRLDKDTSGILIAAKTLETQQKLTSLFSTRQVYKEYLAICVGRPSDGEISTLIGRHPIYRKQMAVVARGKQAISHIETLRWNEQLSVVKVIISTGRTHQIRVHMKHIGTPILGDNLYGNLNINKNLGINRQLLHAAVLRFHHPITKQLLELKAPLPQDISAILSKIENQKKYDLFLPN